MGQLASFNLMKWVADNRHLLKPPVLNKPVFVDSDFIVMIVAGPNVRTDYHVDPYEEFFFQLKGDMTLKTVEDGRLRDVPIPEGGVLLVPPGVPHSPQRPDPESIGLVVERTRPAGVMDGFEWYCQGCATQLHHRDVHVSNIVEDLPPVFEEYYGTVAAGVCPSCGDPNPKKIAA